MSLSPEERFLRLVARVERVIFYSFLGTFLIVILVQGFLSYPLSRYRLMSCLKKSPELCPVMVGVEAGETAPAAVRIKILGHQTLRQAFVMVGEDRITNFNKAEVEITVAGGKEIIIDGSFYKRPLTFKITAVSPGVLSPNIGQEVTTWGSRENLGRVKLN
ncbi:MAG: hypothetical protein GX376_00865 [Firmicutes bacterium]|nr:hypothetical protein [Bacillota bacterium]